MVCWRISEIMRSDTNSSESSNDVQYIGECEHDECGKEATHWIAAEIVRLGIVDPTEERVLEDEGYLCDFHAEAVENSHWEIVESKKLVSSKSVEK